MLTNCMDSFEGMQKSSFFFLLTFIDFNVEYLFIQYRAEESSTVSVNDKDNKGMSSLVVYFDQIKVKLNSSLSQPHP